MIDGIFTYNGNKQIIKILLSIIEWDHQFRLSSSYQNNIKSFINHNYYKYDIIDSNNFIDLLNDLTRNYLDEKNDQEISKDEVVEKCYKYIKMNC